MNRFVVVVCAVACAATWSCATTGGPGDMQAGAAPADGDRPSDATSAPVDPATAEQAALVDSVRSAYTAEDVAFMQGMIHHHAQALVMSRMAPTHGASPDLQVMASRIINAQRDEIDLMSRWLRNRGEPVPEPPTSRAESAHAAHAADGADATGHAMMPGMLSPDDMARLDAARGEEFDRLFLQFMIRHHQGAVTMVEELVANPGAAREELVFKLASDIGADQTSEITRMQTMLRDLLFSMDPSSDRGSAP